MEPDYRRLLELYCGRDIHERVASWGQAAYQRNGERTRVVINQWRFQIPSDDPLEVSMRLARAFDLVYSATEGTRRGAIVDFDFASVLLYFEDSGGCLAVMDELLPELETGLGDGAIVAASLHSGEVLIGNWGANEHFKLSMVGADVEICRAMATFAMRRRAECVLSGEAKAALLGDGALEELGRIGVVAGGHTLVYRYR
jgi:hypothetical protein